jgi:hypothetical protein
MKLTNMLLILNLENIARAKRVLAFALVAGCSPSSAPQQPSVPVVPQQGGSGSAINAVAQSGSGGGAAGMLATAGGPAAAGFGFAATVQPFIDKACNCHQSTPVLMAPFSLKAGEAYQQLVNVPSMQLPSMVRVKPGSTAQSYLWHKIDGTQLQVGGSGMIMPYTFPLTADEKMIFERWINAGALP